MVHHIVNLALAIIYQYTNHYLQYTWTPWLQEDQEARLETKSVGDNRTQSSRKKGLKMRVGDNNAVPNSFSVILKCMQPAPACPTMPCIHLVTVKVMALV